MKKINLGECSPIVGGRLSEESEAYCLIALTGALAAYLYPLPQLYFLNEEYVTNHDNSVDVFLLHNKSQKQRYY